MAWGDNGVTVQRTMIDQSYTINWGNTLARIPTKALNQAGYASRLFVKVPVQAGALTVGAGVSVAAQAAVQRPAFRGINQLDMMLQGIAPFYQLTKGADIAALEYVGNGHPQYYDESLGALQDAPATSVGSLGRASASQVAIGYDVGAAAVSAGAQNVQYSAIFDLPITEWVKFPAYVQQTQKGIISVPSQDVEVGIITLQNTQQNFTPHVMLNPLYSGTVDSPFLQTGGAPTGTMATLIEFYIQFYDVPQGAGNQPPLLSQMFIISRQSLDDSAGGGAATHNFGAAGLLMRALYSFYDVNDNLIDISAQGVQAIATYPLPAQVQEGSISMKWGTTVYKSTERFSINLARAFERYGEPPPVGWLFHDFFRDHTVTELINTAQLTAVQSNITGLPAAVTNLHTVEQRMIPVQLQQA